MAWLGGGKAAEHRSDCAKIFRELAQAEKPHEAHWVAWACTLAPDAIDDWPRAVALAEKAAKSDPKSHSYLNTLGAVLYRAGRLDEAVARLSEADAVVNEPSGPIKSSPAYTWFFLAMAHHRLGHSEKAKKWLDKAAAWTDKAIREADKNTEDLPWNRRLTLNLLRAEAQALLKSAPAPQSPKPAAKEKEKTEKAR
jgi:tetratricopeptide (TPR) repeat protein